jgi:exopolysaccharide biosynthesis protein
VAVTALFLAAAFALPLAPQPAAPFPKIVTDAPVVWEVAPGVSYGDYQLLTMDGPLSVHVVAVDLHDPTVRIGDALAEDRLVSSGETVSSMAARSGAVAGINGDYFDINQTNQPLNILVQNGRLERMPMHRWALAFDAAGAAHFAEFDVTAQAVLQQGTIALKTINDWPPPGGGAVLITPAYGDLHAAENVTEYTLQLTSGTPPFATYRVTGTADNNAAQPPGYYLAIGPQAYGTVPLPNAGDAIAVTGTSAPALGGILTAIGGGPLLVKDGEWYADPDGPNKGEFLTHMPATAAGVTNEGTLLLFEIDGRQPALSIGVLQPQLAQLMIAFGIVNGMQFDGGGSSTIVARIPGEQDASVQNSPSDGQERRVGDALLVYSDAPAGPPAKIATRPQVIRALPGAEVPFSIAVTDAADHPAHVCSCAMKLRVIPAEAGRIVDDRFVAGGRPQDAVIRIDAGNLHQDLPVQVTSEVARARILPLHPALRRGETLDLSARAYDAQGYPIALPHELDWSAADATIDRAGHLAVQEHDAQVRVRLGNRVFTQTVIVGEHMQALDLSKAAFASAPRGGPGAVQQAQPCGCTTLAYDFTGTERAAYAELSQELPERALALSADVSGDGNGEILRVALNNAINERFLYTIAKIDWRGWRHVDFRIPAALPQPVTLKALYVINRVGPGTPVNVAGTVWFRDLSVVLAGSADNSAK